MKKFLKVFTAFLFIIVFTAFPAFAQGRTYRGQIIEPVFTILDLKRGDTYNATLKYTNDSDSPTPLDLSIEVLDFKVGSNGTDKLEISGLPKEASLAQWINLPYKKFTLKQGESKTIQFTIKVPSNADYGGKYASISFVQKGQNTDGAQVPLITRVQHTLLVNIEGQRIEKLEIADFNADKSFYDDKLSIIPFSEKTTDMKFTTDIRNTGNVHISPKGTIDISGGWIGSGESLDFNPANKSSLGFVLPDKDITRKFETTWSDDKFRFGPYKAVLTVQYESNGSPVTTTSTITFWIIPWKIILLIIALIILIFVVIKLWTKVKKNNLTKVKKEK